MRLLNQLGLHLFLILSDVQSSTTWGSLTWSCPATPCSSPRCSPPAAPARCTWCTPAPPPHSVSPGPGSPSSPAECRVRLVCWRWEYDQMRHPVVYQHISSSWCWPSSAVHVLEVCHEATCDQSPSSHSCFSDTTCRGTGWWTRVQWELISRHQESQLHQMVTCDLALDLWLVCQWVYCLI